MRLYIYTPVGKDGQHLSKVLMTEGYETVLCKSMKDLAAGLNDGLDIILTAEEAFLSDDLPLFIHQLKQQPEWSSIPILVFYTPFNGQLSPGARVGEALREFAELNFIPRPISSQVLLNAVSGAVRDRYRQRKVRDLLGELEKDIKRRSESEKELYEKVSELQLERNLREQFVSTLTHDLRTPLTSAKMSAHLISRKATDPAYVQRLSGRIADNIDRADQMIRDLLDANRIKAGEIVQLEMEPLDIVLLVSDTLYELSSIYGDWFKLVAPASLEGHWSKQAIRRIVENLASNAIKYGAPQSWVNVTLATVSDQRVQIQVHNIGPSIPEENQSSVFDPFKRAEGSNQRNQKGWGLGLTLVKGLAEAHGGSVEFKSNLKEGTTFTVSLPIDGRNKSS
jgi:signal transduction histidine kinase